MSEVIRKKLKGRHTKRNTTDDFPTAASPRKEEDEIQDN